jgi:hypothetical protein
LRVLRFNVYRISSTGLEKIKLVVLIPKTCRALTT